MAVYFYPNYTTSAVTYTYTTIQWTGNTSGTTGYINTPYTTGGWAYPTFQSTGQVFPETPEQQKARRAANDRALKLLRSVLDPEQKKEFKARGFFHVHTKDGVRTYRLKPGHKPVRVKDENGETWGFCAYPSSIPEADKVVAQKLMLETDEERFLAVANRFAA